MDNTIVQLEKVLAEKIEKLDKERAEQLAAFNKEQEQRRIIETQERDERIRKFREAEAVRKTREEERDRAEAARIREAEADRKRVEQKENELQEKIRLQQEKLEWIQREIDKVDFADEQHRKAIAPPVEEKKEEALEDESITNAHIISGEAASGTDGLEVGPNLSAHLRSLLRRANSDIN